MNKRSGYHPAAGANFLSNMLTAFALWACLSPGSLLQAASPDFQYVEPRGGQRGAEVKIKVVGNRLWDAEEIVFHQPGITWKDIVHDEKNSGRFFHVTLNVAPDAALGEHLLRIRTKSGLSYTRRFWVSQFPNVLEAAGNNAFETPQKIALNVTVDGSATPETADFFALDAKKGQRLSVEVEGLRANSIRGRIGVDPYVAILNMDRFELVSSDDTPLLKQDCFVSTIVPEDGTYVVEVRDSSYQGNGRYRAHIGTFPRPTVIYPAGGKVGTEVEVAVIGDQKGDFRQKVKVPAEPVEDYGVYITHEGQVPPSPNRFRITTYDNVLENEEKNDSWQSLEASSGSLPLAFNGILQEDEDYDYFRFTAKKGQKFRFRAHAKKINSPVDPVLHVFNDKGATVGGSDDADGSADSRYDFTCPADGDYFVRVYDHLKRGGPDFVYRIESEPFEPALVVTMPEFQRQDNQFRKTMDVPQGGRFAALVNVTRQNVRCDADFQIQGLPAGVSMAIDKMPATITQFPIVFEAKPDAPIGTALATFEAVSADPEKPLRGRYTQMLDWVRANPNNTLYYSTSTDLLPVTVTEPAPFTIDMLPPETPLSRDGRVTMKVVAKRQEGFTKPITVRWLWRPSGISCNSSLTIPEGKSEGTFTISANANAPIETWKVCVLAESDAGKGKVYTSSALVDLPVEDHFIKMTMNLGTVVQGQSGELLIDVEGVKDFEGEATVKLVGLPPKVTTSEVKLKPGQEKFSFPIITEDAAPIGQHKSLFCELVLQAGGKTYYQRAGMGGIVRVDPKPKEPKKPAATTVAKAAAPKPAAPAKPLSRLEQLRLEAKKQAEAK